jgi:hypothetical protein
MTRQGKALRRMVATTLMVSGAALVLAPAARADSGSNGRGGSGAASSIAGYTANIQSLGAQFAFNIPGLIPLPDANLIEEDLPFARTTVSNGPVVNALGAPYYPGDILANFGSLMSEFAAGAPPVPNDPLLAEAEYPPAPGHGQDASFGGTPPAGFPIAPNVFSATAHAAADGSSMTAALTDLSASAPSSTSSSLTHVGPAAAGPTLGAVLGGVAAAAGGSAAGPALDVASIQSTNNTTIGASTVTGTAVTVLKGIDIGGVLSISQLTGSATSTSDGSQGTPDASLHLVDVTVAGQPAYVDQQGVHVAGQSTSGSGVTPQQAQATLDNTFAQDGISVRLLDPSKSTNGAEGIANSGGLVVSISHQFAVPFIPGEPTIPVPGLGNTGLPAGVYTATTSITLGAALADLQATTIPAFNSSPGGLLGSADNGSGVDLGVSPSADNSLGSTDFGSQTFDATGGGGGSNGGVNGLPPALAAGVVHRLPLGLPVPVAFLLAGLILSVLISYPMLLTARWQFISGRRT